MSERVSDLYRRIPEIHCKGLCADSCGVIVLQEQEMQAIGEVPPKTLADGLACPLLTAKGQCSAYANRPLICRLWGVIKIRTFRCPHGCRPKRWLSDDEGRALIDEALAIDPRQRGLHSDVDAMLKRDGDSDAAVRAAVGAALRKGRKP